jgi:signal transduction histidine kinase
MGCACRGVYMAARTIWDASKLSFAVLTPTKRQRRLTLAVAAAVLAATAMIVPFGAIQLRPMDGFIPFTEAVLVICGLVIAALLASQAMTIGSRGLLLLAGGFLFDALIIIPHALTFPGAFAPSGLLGAGLQTTAWLFIFWHLGLPAAVIGYVCMPRGPRPLTAATVYWDTTIVVGLVVLLTWIAVGYGDTLPVLFADKLGFAPLATYTTALDLAVSVVALLALLLRRQKSVFDLWLTVAVVALVAELAVTTFVMTGRFCLSFYASRFLSVAASTIVLIALLAETIRQDARLARTNLALQLERSRKLTTVDAALGAMAHEVKQPLTSIISNAEAAQLMLDHAAPDLEEIRGIVGEIIDGSYRADGIVKNVRSLFRNFREDIQQVDINIVVKDIMHGLHNDMADHHVTSRVKLETELPTILGHRGQLQEVVFNLIHNALDAMKSGPAAGRSLYVRTERRGSKAVGICVQDSGPGIMPEQMSRIFDPFVTTKKDGMGMGLAICRMIVERHGGELSVSPDVDIGARFEIVLPIEPAADPEQSPQQAVAAASPRPLLPPLRRAHDAPAIGAAGGGAA